MGVKRCIFKQNRLYFMPPTPQATSHGDHNGDFELISIKWGNFGERDLKEKLLATFP